MSKREKPADNIQDQQNERYNEKTINELIQKRKIQQEALKKIMNSIDPSEDKTIGEIPDDSQKSRTRIQKIFSTDKKSNKKLN